MNLSNKTEINIDLDIMIKYLINLLGTIDKQVKKS